MTSDNYICVNCGTQYETVASAPAKCSICTDDRESITASPPRWTSLTAMQGRYRNRFRTVEPRVTGIVTNPQFAIGQEIYLIQTEAGNMLWDCLSHLDKETVREINRLGGIAAIAISHPHVYGSMIEWSHAFGRVPIYLHSSDRRWIMRRDEVVKNWDGESLSVLPGLTIVRCGGHFSGSCVLHWNKGSNDGVLFSSDTIQPVEDRRWVSFMHSYPNLIPLSANTVRKIMASIEPYEFERIYGGKFYGAAGNSTISKQAKKAVQRSAKRYIDYLSN